MDIGSRFSYPANALSNLAPHSFTIDGVRCASMEGFLQSLKFKSVRIQRQVCTLMGLTAKRRGNSHNAFWQRLLVLWWHGKVYDRFGQDYQLLLDRAFAALAGNPGFRKALLATNGDDLTHSIGLHAQSVTVLTESEFCSRPMEIRERLRSMGP